jgi:hypothetical protein
MRSPSRLLTVLTLTIVGACEGAKVAHAGQSASLVLAARHSGYIVTCGHG